MTITSLPGSRERPLTYAAALAALANTPAPPPGSSAEQQGLANFKALFQRLDPSQTAARVKQTYARELFFNDTLKTITDHEVLAHYMAETAANVDACLVEIDATHRAGDDFYLRWRMEIRFKKFKRGVPTHSIGISHLRMNSAGQIVLHQDYWDAAGGLFEHVPILGAVIRKIKARL
jgi:hypothetical protein